MPKFAALATRLQPHQQRAVDRLSEEDQPGLVLMHGLGSGKTLSSIAVADALGLPADVVLPAALQANYQKELAKHTVPGSAPDAQIRSLEMAGRLGPGTLKRPLLIVDEAHRARNPGKTKDVLMSSEAKKRLLLTGSLMYNAPSDAAALINLAAGKSLLPVDPTEFQRRYVVEKTYVPGALMRLLGRKPTSETKINPKQEKYLREVFQKYVDYHPSSTENFPERRDEVVHTPLSGEQREIYKTLVNQAPAWVRFKVKYNLPPNKSEASQMNKFLTGVRQVANTTKPFRSDEKDVSPKLDLAAANLKKTLEEDPDNKAVFYSNFLGSGVLPMSQRLTAMGVPHHIFSGEQTKKVRDQYIKDYNENKVRALLLSGAGSEGLDLKGTRLVQVLEPHWNEERIKQVIGRAIRYKSHEHLPPEKRNVLVQRYIATLGKDAEPKPEDGSVDLYLKNMSERKDRLNQLFRDLMIPPKEK